MAFEASILADSCNNKGCRLTTFQVTYPRCVHSELMTHRMFSRNSSSSRAIPIEKMLRDVETDPFIPIEWGRNQKGMQASKVVSVNMGVLARRTWLQARDSALDHACHLSVDCNLHKQIVNRIVEPWMWITVIITSTNYANFFKLRCHPDAEPHIRYIAEMMRLLYEEYRPDVLKAGQWHLPLFGFEKDSEISNPYECAKLSTARCARVSYKTHDGRRDTEKDIELHDKLVSSRHWSPFEHVAQATDQEFYPRSNFDAGPTLCGWKQYRKFFGAEECVSQGVY